MALYDVASTTHQSQLGVRPAPRARRPAAATARAVAPPNLEQDVARADAERETLSRV